MFDNSIYNEYNHSNHVMFISTNSFSLGWIGVSIRVMSRRVKE